MFWGGNLSIAPLGFSGFSKWEDESILAAVLAESQREYFDKLRKGAAGKDKSSDDDCKS